MLYKNETHDEERAFYGIHNVRLEGCVFAGEADGESALKETSAITIDSCRFLLRYPLWHTSDTVITDSYMSDKCRAAMWYDKNITVTGCEIGGIKACRECDDITIKDCNINSTEFGWFCRNVRIEGGKLISEYTFLRCEDMEIKKLHMTAKYSFQYVKNAVFHDCELNTKDAFWHSENVTVYDSVIKGEYLGWYSKNLQLVRCKIIGTQPLCYAEGLVMEDCEMHECDLSFEKSSVTASIKGEIMSVKNPLAGSCIRADSIGELIMEDSISGVEIYTKN